MLADKWYIRHHNVERLNPKLVTSVSKCDALEGHAGLMHSLLHYVPEWLYGTVLV